MSIRSKIVLALGLVAVLWAAADHVLLRTLVTSHFDGITERTAVDAIARAEEDIDREIERIRRYTEGLAITPLVRAAILADDQETLDALFDGESLERAGMSVLVLLASDGTVLEYFARNAKGEETSFHMFPSESIALTNPLLKQPESKRFGSLLSTEHGFLAVCAFAVPLTGELPEDLSTYELVAGQKSVMNSDVPRTTDGLQQDDRERAILIGGTLLPSEIVRSANGHDAVARLTDTMRTELTPLQERGLASIRASEEERVVEESSEGGLVSFRCIDDAEGKPTMLLEAELPADALLEGRKVQQFLALSTIGTSTLIFLVLLRLLQRSVIAPLTRLTRHAIHVGKTDDTTRRISLDRGDEIGQLSVEFDRMLDRLEESRRMIVVSARQAGMSEIATGVLHNVGNVLNSVNVSRSLMERKLEDLAVQDLARTVEVLRKHEDGLAEFINEDPRGRNLLPFLEELSRNLCAQHSEILDESTNLRKSVDHIADLVRSQQAYAGSRGVFEKASLEAELENALKISVQAYGGDMDLEIERNFEEVAQVMIDRHKLMEILINLIQNAKQSMRAAGVRIPRLALGVRQTETNRVEITIKDNGEGIPKENLARIFGHGFTTKKDGHGFGLHVSANAATEMGGELQVTSDGPGLGAQFTLSFPTEACQLSDAA